MQVPKNGIGLLALDLDDTLLQADLTISAANRNAVTRARESGVRIVLASGRNIHSMMDYAYDLGLRVPDEWLIASNGAELVNAETGTIEESVLLDSALCMEIAEEVDRAGFPWQVYDSGSILCSRITEWAELDSAFTGQPVELAGNRNQLFSRGQVKFVIPGEPECIAKLQLEMKKKFSTRAEVLTSKPYFLEVLPQGADKGNALIRLAEKLDLKMENVMAIGDAMNDVGMIKAAGWGCAPANALDSVKKVAKIIAPVDHERDAVAWLIDTVIFSTDQQH